MWISNVFLYRLGVETGTVGVVCVHIPDLADCVCLLGKQGAEVSQPIKETY